MLTPEALQMTVCVEAVNDQIECPRYRKNPAAANQSFGVHFSPPPRPRKRSPRQLP